MPRSLALACALLALSACKPAPTPDTDRFGECQKYAGQIRPQPEREAEAHWRQGDRRLLAVKGDTQTVPLLVNDPAFPGADRHDLVAKFGTREIEGTSDEIDSRGCQEFDDEAADYARRYNAALLRRAGVPVPQASGTAAL